MRFSDVLYQDRAHDTIQRALTGGRVPHAHLFLGRDGVGREMMASRLAAVLLCSSVQEVAAPKTHGGKVRTWREPCGECTDCRMLAAGTHPDFARIYRQLAKMHPDEKVRKKKHLELVVDVVRDFVVVPMGRRPNQGRAKVFVITEADYLNTNAQNALLKTLEEPPEQSYLVLIASGAEKLLPTILSRCSLVHFGGLPAEFVKEQLKKRTGLNDVDANFLAQVSQGSLGETLRLAAFGLHTRVPELIGFLQTAVDDSLGCGKAIMELCVDLAKEMKDRDEGQTETEVTDEEGEGDEDQVIAAPELNVTRAAQLAILAVLGTILRDAQRIVVGSAPVALSSSRPLSNLAARASSESIRAAVHAVSTAEYQLSANANVKLTFDCLGLALGRGLGAETVITA